MHTILKALLPVAMVSILSAGCASAPEGSDTIGKAQQALDTATYQCSVTGNYYVSAGPQTSQELCEADCWEFVSGAQVFQPCAYVGDQTNNSSSGGSGSGGGGGFGGGGWSGPFYFGNSCHVDATCPGANSCNCREIPAEQTQ